MPAREKENSLRKNETNSVVYVRKTVFSRWSVKS